MTCVHHRSLAVLYILRTQIDATDTISRDTYGYEQQLRRQGHTEEDFAGPFLSSVTRLWFMVCPKEAGVTGARL